MSKPAIAIAAVALLGACSTPPNFSPPSPPAEPPSVPLIAPPARPANTGPTARDLVQQIVRKITDREIIHDTDVADVTCTLHDATVMLGDKKTVFKTGYDAGSEKTWRWVT